MPPMEEMKNRDLLDEVPLLIYNTFTEESTDFFYAKLKKIADFFLAH